MVPSGLFTNIFTGLFLEFRGKGTLTALAPKIEKLPKYAWF